MFPYIFKAGGLEIRVYSLMIMASAAAALYFIARKSRRLGINPKNAENLVIGTFFAGIAGARLYYVIFNWGYFSRNLLEIPAIWHGGLAIHGGIIVGTAVGFLLCGKYKIDFFKAADLCSPFVLLGQGAGRFGNFANGEAHGFPVITPPDIIFRIKPVFNDFWAQVLRSQRLTDTPAAMDELKARVAKSAVTVIFEGREYVLKEYVPWGISFPSKYMPAAYREFGTLAVHPTFFYEMFFNFAGAAILCILWRKDSNIGKGTIFGLYLIFYGIIRAFVTFFRADDLMAGFIRAPHLISIILVICGILWIKIGKKHTAKG